MAKFSISVVIVSEIGDISRFPAVENLAAYSETTPRIHSSGGKSWYARAPSDVNRSPKGLFIVAPIVNTAKSISLFDLSCSSIYFIRGYNIMSSMWSETIIFIHIRSYSIFCFLDRLIFLQIYFTIFYSSPKSFNCLSKYQDNLLRGCGEH